MTEKKDNPQKPGPKHKYTFAEDIQMKIDEYFEELKISDAISEPPTVTGLAYHLGFTSRQAIMDQQGRLDEPEIVDAIKRAKMRIEMAHERRLFGTTPTGSIFALKNFGWKDSQALEHTGSGGGPLIIRTNAMVLEEDDGSSD